MNSFRVHTLTVKRLSPGTWDKGVFTEGSESTITIRASIQPLSPHDLQVLPEGRRDSQLYCIYTSTELRLATNSNPDKVVINGEDYEVVSAAPWRNNIINHYRYIVTRIGATPP